MKLLSQLCLATSLWLACFTSLTAQNCATPVGLIVFNPTQTSAALIWANSPGSSYYIIEWHEVGAPTWTSLPSPANAYQLNGLTPCTNYEYRVQTICPGGVSDFSAPLAFMTLCGGGCDAPTGAVALNITETSASFFWAAGNGAIGYLLDYHPVGSADWTTLYVTNNSIPITGLIPCTSYEYRIASVCNGDTSNYNATNQFVTACNGSCDPPTGAVAFNQTFTSASLVWAAGTGGIGYEVEWREQGTAWSAPFYTASNGFQLNDLEPCNDYEFRVRSICTSDTSVWTVSATFMTQCSPTPCDRPYGLAADTLGTTFIALTWDTIPGANGYFVSYRKKGELTIQNIATGIIGLLQINDLTPCTPYEIWIKTNCGAGLSDNSDTATISTICPPCNIPGGMVSTNITTTSAGLLWAAPDYSQGYQVRLHANGSPNWTTSNVATNSFQANGLIVCTWYEAQVRNVCINDTSAWGPILPFQTTCTIANNEVYAPRWSISPNPANDEISMETDLQGAFSVELIDLLGNIKIRAEMTNHSGRERLDLNEIPVGIYWLRMTQGTRTVGLKKLVKVKQP